MPFTGRRLKKAEQQTCQVFGAPFGPWKSRDLSWQSAILLDKRSSGLDITRGWTRPTLKQDLVPLTAKLFVSTCAKFVQPGSGDPWPLGIAEVCGTTATVGWSHWKVRAGGADFFTGDIVGLDWSNFAIFLVCSVLSWKEFSYDCLLWDWLKMFWTCRESNCEWIRRTWPKSGSWWTVPSRRALWDFSAFQLGKASLKLQCPNLFGANGNKAIRTRPSTKCCLFYSYNAESNISL